MWVRFPPLLPNIMKDSQKRYLEEYEKHKHIEIVTGSYYVKGKTYLKYEVVMVDTEKETALIERNGSGMTKTLHWCRKNLVKG